MNQVIDEKGCVRKGLSGLYFMASSKAPVAKFGYSLTCIRRRLYTHRRDSTPLVPWYAPLELIGYAPLIRPNNEDERRLFSKLKRMGYPKLIGNEWYSIPPGEHQAVAEKLGLTYLRESAS